jgi:hypothetical protein
MRLRVDRSPEAQAMGPGVAPDLQSGATAGLDVLHEMSRSCTPAALERELP